MLLISALAIAVGVMAYQFGVSLRTSADAAPATTIIARATPGQENPAQNPS
jgi:hypothetical protein